MWRLFLLLLFTSSPLLTLPTATAKLELETGDIRQAIQYGQQFDSQQAVIQQFGRLGYHKTIDFLVGHADVFLITDFVRVAARSAGVQRYGGTLGAHTFQEKLQGKLDVVVFINAGHGYFIAEPIISIEHADGRLSPESVTKMKVYSNCDVREPVLYLNWTDLCKAINGVPSAWEEGGAWLFSFSLPEKYWNSKVKLVWGKDSGKAAKKEFDLSKLH